MTVPDNEVAPIVDRLANDEVRWCPGVRITVIRYEICGWHDAPVRMAHPDERLGAADVERARVELRLIPEFEPARAYRLGHIDRRTQRLFDGEERGDAVT